MEIITRQEAKARGLKRYFTGELCKRGHLAERFACNTTCRDCQIERRRVKINKRYLGLRQKALAAELTRYFTGKPCKHGHLSERTVKNAACIMCHRERQRLRRAKLGPAIKKIMNRRYRLSKLGSGTIQKWDLKRATIIKLLRTPTPRYFTGKPCKHGHVAERYVSQNACVECRKERRIKNAGKWRMTNERMREAVRKAGKKRTLIYQTFRELEKEHDPSC